MSSALDRSLDKLQQGLPFVVGVRAEKLERKESKREIDRQNYDMFIRQRHS